VIRCSTITPLAHSMPGAGVVHHIIPVILIAGGSTPGLTLGNRHSGRPSACLKGANNGRWSIRRVGPIHCFQSHDERLRGSPRGSRYLPTRRGRGRNAARCGGRFHRRMQRACNCNMEEPSTRWKRRKAVAAVVRRCSLRRRLAHPCYDISPKRSAEPVISALGK
jgi:hypothetical protein